MRNEYDLDKLRTTPIKGFIIGPCDAPVWKQKEHTPEEHYALVDAACADTEMEQACGKIKEEAIGKKRKARNQK